jgi:leader peptidase (prepilin peptidase)/N-methyltransferase
MGTSSKLLLGLIVGTIYVTPWAVMASNSNHFSLPTASLSILLAWITFSDIKAYRIPNPASFCLVMIGCIHLIGFTKSVVVDHVLTSIFWPIVFYVVAKLFQRFRGIEGLGFGDVKLISGIGIWLGFIDTQLTILWATLAAISFLLGSSLVNGSKLSEITMRKIPLGAFLCFFAWVFWLKTNFS